MQRSRKLLWLLVLLAPLLMIRDVRNSLTRSVRPLLDPAALEDRPFDPKQSAGLFVGASEFDNGLNVIQFAVDDAVDLAYAFTHTTVPLLLSRRVTIAISGPPRKKESKQRLEELRREGANIVMKTGQAELLSLVRHQSSVAGPGGILIMSFATHGISRNGAHFLLASSSNLRDERSMLPTAEILDLATESPTKRSLILIDACRERVKADTRAGEPDGQTAAPFLKKMARVEGQAVLYAAVAGAYAYDDPEHRNGVFTRAVIDGLQCGTSRQTITVQKLADYVETHVLEFLQKKDPSVQYATQVSVEGFSRNMPLADCRPRPLSPLPTSIASIKIKGSTFEAFDMFGKALWQEPIPGTIAGSAVQDLDNDGNREVILGVNTSEKSGKIIVFNGAHKHVWTAATERITELVVAPVFFREPRAQIVTLVQGTDSTQVVVYGDDGQTYPKLEYPGELKHIQIGQENGRSAPRIIVTGVNDAFPANLHIDGAASTLLVLDTRGRKISHLWQGAITQPVVKVEITDYDNNRKKDITLSTTSGIVHLDFDGAVIAIERGSGPAPQFIPISPSSR